MKAVILSHENGGSYVVDKTGSFKFVKGYESRPIGTEINLKPAPVVYFPKVVVMAACFVLTVLLGTFAWMWTAESHFIYVDVNPSIRLTFNRFDRLIDATPLNESGEELLSDLNLRGNSEEVVVSLIYSVKSNGNYDDAEYPPMFLLTFASLRDHLRYIYAYSMAEALESNGLQNVTIAKIYGGDYRYIARELGISPGRVRLANAMMVYDYHATELYEFLNMALRDLITKAQ